MFNIHFTRSSKLGSHLIRAVTGETVSHCVIEKGGMVLHSTFLGLKLVLLRVFLKENSIVYTLSGVKSPTGIAYLLDKYWEARYDYRAFLALGLRLLSPKLASKVDIRGLTGSFLCTEFVSVALGEGEDSEITPYKLYLKLKEKEQTDE